MTMNNRGLWLAGAGSFAIAFFAASCGTPDPVMPTTCSSDAACGMGKGCHPVLKTCVATCTGATDCPSDQKTCAKINNSASSFCTCSTDALCSMANTGFICNAATQQCSAKCTSNANCPSGFTCDTATGQCGGGGGNDGGMDGGMDAGVACSGLGTCTYPEVCNFTAGRCQAGAACNASAVQPDTCGKAGYCTTNSNCAQVPAPTCANFGAGGLAPVFNPTTSTGPIIYYVENDPSPPAANCFKGFFVHSFYLNVYQDSNWPAQLMAMPGAWYVTTNGMKQDITAGLPPSYYVPNGKELRLRKYLCAKQSTSLSAGFYYTGGNEICADSAGAVAGTASCTTNADCGTGSTCNMGTGTCS